jgi:hypothetical protein
VSDEAAGQGSESLPLRVAGSIDRACDRYEAEWKRGLHRRIEAYLADAPEHDRSALFRELLLLGIELRGAGGERPIVEEYRARFSEFYTAIGSAARRILNRAVRTAKQAT